MKKVAACQADRNKKIDVKLTSYIKICKSELRPHFYCCRLFCLNLSARCNFLRASLAF